jgi:hypothetical protein
MSKTTVSEEAVRKFETLMSLLKSMHEELREFAKRKQDGAVSKTRVAMINRLLSEAKELLKEEDTARFLDLLDEDTVPQNADAALVLGQYVAAMNQFHDRHTTGSFGDLRWLTPEPEPSRKGKGKGK